MLDVERVEIVATLSPKPPPIVRPDTVVVDHHLVAVLSDGSRVVDAGYGGSATSTLSACGFRLTATSTGPTFEALSGISLGDADSLLRAELESSDESWGPLLAALASAGVSTDPQSLRAVPLTVDASHALRIKLAPA